MNRKSLCLYKSVCRLFSAFLLVGVVAKIDATEIDKSMQREPIPKPTSAMPTNSSNYVSEELFDLIRGWKSVSFKTMELEEFIAEKDEDLYFLWLKALERNPGQASISDYFSEADPTLFRNYLSEIQQRGEEFDLTQFMDYLRVKNRSAYQQLNSTLLLPQGISLQKFIQARKPDLLLEWEKDKQKGTFNIQGSLANYIDNHHQSTRVLEEARIVLANMGVLEDRLPTGERGRDDSLSQDRGAECNCSVTITNSGNPASGGLYTYTPLSGSSTKKNWSLNRSAIGAAHSLKATRYTSGLRENEVDSSLSTNYRSATLSLGCVDELSYACAGYCSGEVVAQAQYHADLKADIQITNGISVKRGSAVAADRGKLTLISAGLFGATETVLFNKALAVEREHQTEYDSAALMALVKAVAGIVSTIVTGADGSAIASAISADASSSIVKNAIGLIKKTGKSSSHIDKDMLAYFSTSDLFSNIPFDNNTSRTFKLASDGRVHVEGRNGNHNSGWAQVDSAYYLAVGAKNFSCSGDVTSIPADTSNWSYGRTTNSEMSASTIQSNISGFFNMEMGQLPDFSSGYAGTMVTVIPPQPPVSVCSVTPNIGINSLNATMNGTVSSDADGTIVSYEWLRYPGTVAETLMATGATAGLVITDAPKSFMGPGGIHLRVTDDSGLSHTSYCGHVIVKCIDGTGQPCPIPSYPAAPAVLLPW